MSQTLTLGDAGRRNGDFLRGDLGRGDLGRGDRGLGDLGRGERRTGERTILTSLTQLLPCKKQNKNNKD